MADSMTAWGLSIMDLETRISEIKDSVHSVQGLSAANLESETPLGGIIRIFAEREQALAELAQEIYAGSYPSSAGGFQLNMVCQYTGTERRAATKTLVECTVNIDPGTYGAGTLIGYIDGNPDLRFSNMESVTNSGGAAADFDIDFECEDTGPIPAYAHTLDNIAESVTGFNSIDNDNPHTSLGQLEETDPALRARRRQEVAQAGSTTSYAIMANLSAQAGVLWVLVLENETDNYDMDGLKPHSIAVYIHAPTLSDFEIATLIYGGKPSGISTNGSTTEVFIDTYGLYHGVDFTKVTQRTLYLDISITEGMNYIGSAAVKNAVADWVTANWGIGHDVILSQISSVVIGPIINDDGTTTETGVEDVTLVEAGWTASPTGTVNLPVDFDELVYLISTNITITS